MFKEKRKDGRIPFIAHEPGMQNKHCANRCDLPFKVACLSFLCYYPAKVLFFSEAGSDPRAYTISKCVKGQHVSDMGQELARALGPESGGECCHIQLAASH